MSTDGKTSTLGLPAIAPAPPDLIKTSPAPMAHSCRTCARRKVKCDKAVPACSACRRTKIECIYQTPAPASRGRKRKLGSGLSPLEKIAEYERVLEQLGVLDSTASPSSADTPSTNKDATPQQEGTPPIRFIPWGHSQTTKVGKLLASQGKSRYIDSDIWSNLGDDADDDHPLSDDEPEDEGPAIMGNLHSDPLTDAFLGTSQQDLSYYHPAHATALALWQIHAENVEPLCKILHIPTTAAMVERVSQRPDTALKTEECLLFAIYHFAVFSMTDTDCLARLNQHRSPLLERYHFAARQALANAAFLRTTNMSILQALVLFLMATRHSYDPHTFWILTGVAVRIAQRMGLHRDGEKLGLPPFEVQMRRRLFYQLLPLDGTASHMCGVGVMMPPDGWDTQPALNVNDEQIWPGMTEPPKEPDGATDMIFCLSRFFIGKSISGAGKKGTTTTTGLTREFADYAEAEREISEAENEVETRYIRYCDVINPLHFLAIGLARSGITAMRLRIRLPRARTQDATDAERRDILQLAQKILDTDAAAHDHAGLVKRFGWHVKSFFLWGMWDSLVYILTTLWTRRDILSLAERKAAWDRLERLYRNHGELFDTKRALHVAFQRLTLKAWDANHDGNVSEPEFIVTLRSLRRGKQGTKEKSAVQTADGVGGDAVFGNGMEPTVEFEMTDDDLNLDSVDWTFWERLIQSDHPVVQEETPPSDAAL
ncbi:putative C6 transcription factor [Echria macrotheca]|uniref:C6 transcription factor n=1 Tax=Echria macrotheca TaxID=438768 RepID=A0AAJ0BE05_9PEZI|nr:putative C6 transcription factor [Echria macrotheca]